MTTEAITTLEIYKENGKELLVYYHFMAAETVFNLYKAIKKYNDEKKQKFRLKISMAEYDSFHKEHVSAVFNDRINLEDLNQDKNEMVEFEIQGEKNDCGPTLILPQFLFDYFDSLDG